MKEQTEGLLGVKLGLVKLDYVRSGQDGFLKISWIFDDAIGYLI